MTAIGVARMWHEPGFTHRPRSGSRGAGRLLTCKENTRAGDGNRTRIASLEGYLLAYLGRTLSLTPVTRKYNISSAPRRLFG